MPKIRILVKSFNRPFYLDRCLTSIERQVKGNFLVVVLDDGTPQKYLDKIRAKHPNIELKLSEAYKEKIQAIEKNIEEGTPIDGFKIPTELWRSAVEQAEEYVLVTEDDVWFTQEVDLEKLVGEMAVHHLDLLKLGWHGNHEREEGADVTSISEDLVRTYPLKLFTGGKWLMDIFLTNKFKFFSLLYRLGMVDNHTTSRYWILNSISMGLYRKEYWLAIWEGNEGKMDEKLQLRNAAVWFHRNKSNKNLIARTAREYMKTTFQSSATGSYHQAADTFDVNYFNHLANTAWFEGRLDSMQNYPKDFSLDYLQGFADDKIDLQAFDRWVEHFKETYRRTGAKVDD